MYVFRRNSSLVVYGYAAPLDYIVYFTAFSIPAFYSVQVAHIVIAENATQLKRTFNGAGFFALSINLILLWVSLLTDRNSGKLMISVIPFTTFGVYPGLKGLFMIGVDALTISTSAANVHAATVLMTNDLPDLFKLVKKLIIYHAMVGVPLVFSK